MNTLSKNPSSVRSRLYRKKNRLKHLQYSRDYQNARYRTDPQYRALKIKNAKTWQKKQRKVK